MNQNQIRCFLEIARTKSFSKTAENLFLTQPAVSKQIKTLEKELGDYLFTRVPHKQVELTPTGQIYYNFFRKMEREYKKTQAAVQNMKTELSGVLNIGFLSGWDTAATLRPFLESFQSRYPHVELRQHFYDPGPLRRNLKQGNLDLIVTLEDGVAHIPHIKYYSFCPVPRMLFISEHHPMVRGKEHVTVDDFKNVLFYIVSDEEIHAEELVREHLGKDYHFNPEIRMVPTIEHAIACTYNGQGAALLDAWSREMNNSAFVHVPLTSCNQAVLAWNTERTNKLTEIFVERFELSWESGGKGLHA